MATTGQRMRQWRGPAIFSFGFRPFFFGGALWAALAMAMWIPMLSGRVTLPTAFDPVSWHAHEFLFGYLGAVIAGFLLTAVPNWTGRLPIVGWPLALLFSAWLAGRIAVACSTWLSPALTLVLDIALPVSLGLALAREVIAGKNWRNLGVVGLLAVFAAGNARFHLEAIHGEVPAQGLGLRIGLGAAILLIALIGGRIIPSFTRNWLMRQVPGRLPAPPEQPFDKVALVVLLGAIIAWMVWPVALLTGLALALAGVLHLVRLLRWAGYRTAPEPLLWVLHIGYAFVPIGALAMAAAIAWPEVLPPRLAQHLWMAGAIGLMTLAVMTRATRGHTGRPLSADRPTAVLYLALVVAVLARLAAGLQPAAAMSLYTVAGTAWIIAFGGFCLVYGPMLLTRRPD